MRSLRMHVAVLVVYTLVAVGVTFPLILNLSTAIPGIEGDAPSFVWALGWARTAIEQGADLFHTDYVFYPLGGATQLLWAVSLIGILSIPLQAVLGLVTAHNLLYIAATVFTGYGTFLLAEEALASPNRARPAPLPKDQTLGPFATLVVTQFVVQQRLLSLRRPLIAPFTAGLVFAFAPLRLGYGLGFFNLFNTQFIPFYLLFLLRAVRRKSIRPAILAGILLGLNAYVDFQIAAFLILLTLLYGAYQLTQAVIAKESIVTRNGVIASPSLMAQHPAGKGLSSIMESSAPRTRSLTNAGQDDKLHNSSRALPLMLRFARNDKLRRFWGETTPVLIPFAIIAVVSLVTALPILGAVANDFAIEGGDYVRVFKLDYSAARSYDLFSYFVPHARSTLYAASPLKIADVNAPVRAGDESAQSPDRQGFLGYAALLLAIYAALKRPRAAGVWLVFAFFFALVSLGPWLRLGGESTGIPLPFLALHEIPIINHIRIPMRYGIVVSLAVSMLVAIAVRELTAGKWRPLTLLLPVAVLAEFVILPFPLQELRVPGVYDQIAASQGDFSILEIPTFNWRWASEIEAFQATHGKRILRAYTNRIAPDVAEYFAFRGTPIVVRSLRILEGIEKGDLSPEEIAEDTRAQRHVLSFFNLRYVVTHKEMLTPEQAHAIDEYVQEVLGGSRISEDETTVAFILPAAAVDEALSIDLRENIGQMYAGRGWQFEYPPANWNAEFNFVWVRGTRSEIYFVTGDAQDRLLTVNAFADPPQRVSVRLNGHSIGDLTLAGWDNYKIALPERALHAGMNRFELVYNQEMAETIGVTTIQIRRGQDGAQTSR